MKNKLTIIVPMYNCEKTIIRCLDSIFNQDTTIDLELILVNDGSLDRTQEIVEDYIKTKKNIILLSQKNKGAGAARNLALSHAHGDYLLFVDADDQLHPNSISIIDKEISSGEIEILVFLYRYFDESSGDFKEISERDSKIYKDKRIKGKIFSFSDFPEIHEAIAYPWNKVFKASFVKNNQLKFSETIVHNDIFFNIASTAKSKKTKVIPDILYIHNINSLDGQLTQIFDERRLDALIALEECESFLKKEQIAETLKRSFNAFKADLLDWIIQGSSGDLKRKFMTYFKNFLQTLTPEELIKLRVHPLVSANLRFLIDQSGVLKGAKLSTKNELLLSVIVPVYNVENYLEKCLQSIADQTLNPVNFEVILVDDKSTDSSLDICKNFCNRYSNFRLIELPENSPGGCGTPSNRGIETAKGKYIGFVDSDDYIEPDMFECLLTKGLETESDLIICGYHIHYEKENIDVTPWEFEHRLRPLVENASSYSLRETRQKALELNPAPWRKLYKRSFLKKYNIKFPEGNFFFEDTPFHWFVVVQAESFSFINKKLIHYRVGRFGQTVEAKPEKFLAITKHAEIIFKFLESKKIKEEYNFEFLCWILDVSTWVIPKLGDKKSIYLNKIKEYVKDNSFAHLKLYKKIRNQNRGKLYFNYFLIHGQYRMGLIAENFENNFRKFRKKFF